MVKRFREEEQYKLSDQYDIDLLMVEHNGQTVASFENLYDVHECVNQLIARDSQQNVMSATCEIATVCGYRRTAYLIVAGRLIVLEAS